MADARPLAYTKAIRGGKTHPGRDKPQQEDAVEGQPPTGRDRKEWSDPEMQLDKWHKYESIAMHFNDLLKSFRLQALGGTAAVGSVAGFLSKDGSSTWGGMPYVLGFLCVAWIALWILDIAYYRRLLNGAVKALVEFEKNVPELQLSTKIETEVGRRPGGNRFDGNWAPNLFYCLILAALAVCFLKSWPSHSLSDSKTGDELTIKLASPLPTLQANVSSDSPLWAAGYCIAPCDSTEVTRKEAVTAAPTMPGAEDSAVDGGRARVKDAGHKAK